MKRALAYTPSRGVDEYVRRVSAATPMELIQLERSGVSARFVKDLAIRIGGSCHTGLPDPGRAAIDR